MKRILEIYSLAYGCLGSICASAWYVLAIFNEVTFPPVGPKLFIAAAALNWTTLIVTFYRTIGEKRPWKPVLAVTPTRIKTAKIILSFALMFAAVNFAFFVWPGLHQNYVGRIDVFLISALLLQMIYLAVHWGIRPDSIFPRSFSCFIANPLAPILVPLIKRMQKRSPQRAGESEQDDN